MSHWHSFRILLVSLALLVATSAQAFGELGHQVIAALAEDMLTRNAKMQIRSILPPSESGDFSVHLIQVAVWADEIRSLRPETRPWHFVTLQLGEKGYAPGHTDSPSVVTALERQLAILGTASSSSKNRYAREEALKWVVHLVGDLHQPLHVGEDHDRGGNEILVRINRRTFNLHAVCDFALLERLHLELDSLHALLGRDLAADPAFIVRNASGTVRAWVDETHAKSRGCYLLNGKAFPKGTQVALNEEYIHLSTLQVLNQLKLAAIRLAWLLNTTLDPTGQKKPVPPTLSKGSRPFHVEEYFTHSDKVFLAVGKRMSSHGEKGKYAWSAHSETYHFSNCRQVTRIKRKNLQTGDIIPQGRHLHAGCPTRS